MKTISIASQKGGTGKTTTALAIAHNLAARNKRVLLIDLDTQANASASLGIKCAQPNIEDVLHRRRINITQAIRNTGSIHSLPASRTLAIDKESIDINTLKEIIKGVEASYDFCVIDTPPELGTLLLTALTASDYVIIVSQADIYSLDALERMGETIEAVRDATNTNLKPLGVLLTFYNPRTVLAREILASFTDTAKDIGTNLFTATIRRQQAAADAAALRKPIREYAPKAGITADYEALTDEILGRLKNGQV